MGSKIYEWVSEVIYTQRIELKKLWKNKRTLLLQGKSQALSQLLYMRFPQLLCTNSTDLSLIYLIFLLLQH